jgi:hypothetical protein
MLSPDSEDLEHISSSARYRAQPYRRSGHEKDTKSLTSGPASRSTRSKVVAAKTSIEKPSTVRKNGHDPSLPLC